MRVTLSGLSTACFSMALVFAAQAADRPTPPTRPPNAEGAPKFTQAPSGGNAPIDALGDFLIGPVYPPADELIAAEGVPKGTVQQFVMKSEDSKFYPGVARDVFGSVDPNNPRTLIVE